jgi:hypothetical protein
VAQKKDNLTLFQSLRAPLSYDKNDAELEASRKADVDKWMVGIKKVPPPKKFDTAKKAERKMLRCLAQPKKPMCSDYKHTMRNPHCGKRSDEILQN